LRSHANVALPATVALRRAADLALDSDAYRTKKAGGKFRPLWA
jgi:hypothetical protein